MRFLFTAWSGGGNIHPLVALGTRLLARGHDVRVLAGGALRQRFESAGMTFEEQPGKGLRAVADDVEAAIARERPDVVVVDFMQPAALCAAETANVPLVAFVHTLYTRVAVSAMSPMGMSGSVDGVNDLRHDLGLPPVESLPALLDPCALVLVVTAVELDRPHEPVPANVRFVGPLVEGAGADAGWAPPGSPLVHVSMGTVPSDADLMPIVQHALDAIAGLDVHGFVTLAGKADRPWSSATDPDIGSLRVPANCAVSGYVRHAAVLPHTAVFVTHAGLGSVGVALTFGVPMVALPITHEQPANAAHVAALGAGVQLDRAADADALRDAIVEVMREPRYRDTARRVGDRLRADGNGQRAVDELESL